MKALTEQQVRDYRYNGYLFPVDALTPAEAAQALRDLERTEAALGMTLPNAPKNFRTGAFTCLPWVERLVRHPRILDIVEDVLGPDILVFTATFFIKEPGAPTFAAWHQDATYFGLTPHEHVTAWVALTDATSIAGCMDVLSFRGVPKQHHHAAARLDHSINGAGQVIVEPLDESSAVAMELKAGQASLHHTLCAHRSAPNRAAHRRVGFGISYIPAYVRPNCAHRLSALLVRGKDHGTFDLLPSPGSEFDADALAVNKTYFSRYTEHYQEQVARHEQEFGRAPRSVHA
jgi:ectoine hydroxylase-related dioxygenase (phytanoyl-CoA dioxygenase family)